MLLLLLLLLLLLWLLWTSVLLNTFFRRGAVRSSSDHSRPCVPTNEPPVEVLSVCVWVGPSDL